MVFISVTKKYHFRFVVEIQQGEGVRVGVINHCDFSISIIIKLHSIHIKHKAFEMYLHSI